MITIFTPTYNRAYRLSTLYKSLISQTAKNFEWIIVDDDSTDETFELVNKWILDKKLKIIYYKQNINGGKHRCINKGVELAHGELFFIVDSDDFLTNDAIEQIELNWTECKNPKNYAGLCFRRMIKNPDSKKDEYKILGKDFPSYICSGTSIDITYKWKCINDKAEIFKTEVLRKYPFPDYKNEKFCQEAIIWYKIAKKRNGLLLCINKGIYICEYLPDGLTSNFVKKSIESPRYTALYTLTLLSIPYEWKVKKIGNHLKTLFWMIYRIYFRRFFKHDS